MDLEEIADVLENADRMGSENDKPEGLRYIQISDTLARIMASEIRKHNQNRLEE